MNDERYLVTGARGMLGQALTAELLARGCSVTPTDLPDVDLTDEAAARRLFDAIRPTRVIHCAAYTAVDRAESDQETCRRVNVEMPAVVARACARAGAAMLLISTDFVFDGEPPLSEPPEATPSGATLQESAQAAGESRTGILPVSVPPGPSVAVSQESRGACSAPGDRQDAWPALPAATSAGDSCLASGRRPYREDDPPRPLSVYGQTKLDGERAVAAALERHQIVRTAWLYGPGKRNFVSGMLERLWRGEHLRVVYDQTGSPTYTLDLAAVLADLSGAGATDESRAAQATGIFHVVNSGQTTWCGLVRRAAELAGLDTRDIEAIPTSGYPTPARRPVWSVLDCSRAQSLGVSPMRPWDEALAEYVGLLSRERGA